MLSDLFLISIYLTSLGRIDIIADLWGNVFDELPVSKINEAANQVEDKVASTSSNDDDVLPGDHTHSSRLMDFIEATRRTSKAARKNLQQKLYGTKTKMTLRQLGIPLDEEKALYEGKLCFKMQNFGNNDGYSGVMTGSECTAEGENTATAYLNWKSESFFTIQCHKGDNNQTTMVGMRHAYGDDIPTIRAALGQQSTGFLGDMHALCTLSIASQNPWSEMHGTGALVHSRIPLVQRNGTHDIPVPLNAIHVRMCNIVSGPNTGPNEATISLESMQLNGKLLTSETVLSESQQLEECHGYTYRIPTVAVSESFVLTGHVGISGDGFGPGGSSSIEISIGRVHSSTTPTMTL